MRPRISPARPDGSAAALVRGLAAAPSAHTLQALEHGAALALTDAAALSGRLYRFGAAAPGLRWNRLAAFAETAGGLVATTNAARHRPWLQPYDGSAHPSWLAWHRRAPGDLPHLPFKLYVSPQPEYVADHLEDIAATLSKHEVASFKIGRGVPGLLRPDKIVAYCESLEQLGGIAAELRRRLAGCPAHGVAFTAGCSQDGLLSWGMDPASQGDAAGGATAPAQSWRLWVTNRLAAALIEARAEEVAAPVAFALDRLALACTEAAWPTTGRRPEPLHA